MIYLTKYLVVIMQARGLVFADQILQVFDFSNTFQVKSPSFFEFSFYCFHKMFPMQTSKRSHNYQGSHYLKGLMSLIHIGSLMLLPPLPLQASYFYNSNIIDQRNGTEDYCFEECIRRKAASICQN